MEIQEVFLSPVFEDFAVGDRVYRYDSHVGETVFGNIVRIKKGEFRVRLDDEVIDGSMISSGQEVDVQFPAFERNSKGGTYRIVQWAKALNLSEVDTGSVLSLVDYESQTRQYFTVLQFPSNKTFIRLTFKGSKGRLEHKLLADEHAESLEFQLKDYVLEG